MENDPNLVKEFFKSHYSARLGEVAYTDMELSDIDDASCLESPFLKSGNGPRLFLHQQAVRDVIILTHGLSDSPFYLQAVAQRFYQQGCQVIMPLLPAHGLIDPDEEMEDKHLDRKWRETIDHAVQTATMLGSRISIGGFSTGGALSLNRILRDSGPINGGLFLFSGALSIGDIAETAGRLKFIQSFALITDGKVAGVGRDPYKYPELPKFAGLELVEIIQENRKLNREAKVKVPVFAAHSIHDKTAELDGILKFMEKRVEKGVTLVISSNVSHACLPLAHSIPLNTNETRGPALPPPANPLFDWMMEGAIRFFKEEVMNR